MEINHKHHHWETIAHNWSNVGYPLRPSPADSENFAKLLDLPNRKSVRALILGVTPELYGLDWPAGSEIFSVDRSTEMIGAIWPGPDECAYHANWLELPFPDESLDYVICDGGLHLLDHPESQQKLSSSISRVLKPDGQFVIRLFSMPPQAEDASTVISDLNAGKIPNIHVLKLRMGMAMQKSSTEGIVLNEVFEGITFNFGGLDGLQSATGWPRDEVFTLKSYQRSTNRYHFVTDEQSVAVLSSNDRLSVDQRIESDYTLGERCPLYSFKKT